MRLLRRRSAPLKWSVVVASPKGEAGAQWGDTWFAADLVEALNDAGQQARVVHRGGAESDAREKDDVVLVLRGLRRVRPRRGKALWLLWVISHPELVEEGEPEEFDSVFAASAHWDRVRDFSVPVTPLLQATNPHRFRPDAGSSDTGPDVLFVGSTRGEYRPAVRACIENDIAVSIYGVGWPDFVSADRIAGEFLPNDSLPQAYASAGVVLNDHWPQMAQQGFLSNRLFDAAACGARIASDDAVGLRSVFGGGVRTYGDAAELAEILRADRASAFPSEGERRALADHVAAQHSFDARAEVLIARVMELRGT